MEIRLAKTAGFCMGVSLALKKLDTTLATAQGPIHTLGPIIHNPQVLAMYEAQGVRQISSPEEAEPGSTVVIRAHGIPRELEETLRGRGVRVVDATCPKVKKAQLLIQEHSSLGQTLMLYGEENHPEVRGLLSYAGPDALVFGSLEELLPKLEADKDYFMAAQTTQDKVAFQEIRAALSSRIPKPFPVLETICDATKVRQEEAVSIAREVDRMVVVGGYQSGNTRRLAKVVLEQGVDCTHVETAEELDPAHFKDCTVIGLTAGASTHDKTIEAVRAALAALPPTARTTNTEAP
ncbi:4-hydroxy-3-methylbut-2-enyl diphosphate reductase [Desulfocurvus sp. DL9XJH121]